MSYDELVQSISEDLDALEAIEASRSGICFSCLQERTGDQLGECLTCRSRICGIGECKGTCLCTLMEEDTGEDDE